MFDLLLEVLRPVKNVGLFRLFELLPILLLLLFIPNTDANLSQEFFNLS